MKLHVNAVKKGVELVFGIRPPKTVSDINRLKADKLHELFEKTLEKARAKYKGYNDEIVKQNEFRWVTDYLQHFTLGNPYHLLLTRYISYLKDDTLVLDSWEQENEAFGNLLLTKLSNSEYHLKTFAEKALGDKDNLMREIIELSEKMDCVIDANEIMQYCRQNHFLHNYLTHQDLDYDDERNTDENRLRHKKVSKDINWLLKKGALLLKNNNLTDCVRLFQLFEKIINYTYLEQDVSAAKQVKQPISFVWEGNTETELPKLHQRLIKAEMIDEQTDLEAFKATFTGHSIDNIKPIKWTATNRLLAYFLDKVVKERDWQSMAEKGKLFLNKNDKLLTQSDLSSANDRKYGKPKGSEKIDEILAAIKKH